ncbi:hypothetical protein ISS04_04640 [Candidatus Woesearchaeota archaeon]|nr:hypothetical protein [Candidatus Woesearchaeota archaeon]
MKKSVIIFVGILLALVFALGYFQLTGRVVQGPPEGRGGPAFTGPTQEQISCMETCSGCTYGDATCFEQHSTRCGTECGVETSGPPKPADEGETCMQKCILVGCDEFNFICQNSKMDSCEDECGMKGDAPDESEMSEEQLCISNCVAAEDPTVICGNSQEGETGNALCQRCAAECVHLYAGPCLNDEDITTKEKECETCEHCYGEPVMGPSGQGWDCIVDVECKDASSEFGDEPGEGPGIGQEGYVAPNPIAGAIDKVIKFFKGVFGGEVDNQEEQITNEPESPESS